MHMINFFKSIKNDNKGVSMVTLVITIIVILILSAATFVSSLKTIEKTSYSKYISNVSDVSFAFEETAAIVKGKKVIEDKAKYMEQIYNYVARNGDEEKDFLNYMDVPKYTIIRDEEQIGIDLPDMIVESGTGKKVHVKYAATSQGKIFTWPPLDYENKFYITGEDTVEHKMQTNIKVGEEEFEIKINPDDGTLLDWLVYDDDNETPSITPSNPSGEDDPLNHTHVFTSKTQTEEYLCSEATCTTPMKYYFKCENCDAKGTNTYGVGMHLGHILGEETLIKEANCTEKGIVQSRCSRCENLVTSNRPLNSANHHGGETEEITKQATCEEEGEKIYKCKSCNVALRSETIPFAEHNMNDFEITKEPTCTEKGTKTYLCSMCGQEMKNEDIDTLEHDEKKTAITKEPTCTETGIKTYSCSNCNKEMRTVEISVLGHEYGSYEVTKDATCKEKGIKTKKCVRCSNTQTEEIPVDTSRHYGNEETKETKKATCTETGVKETICSLCKKVLRSETVTALGHDWNVPERPRKCNRCGLEENLTAQAVYTSDDKTLTFIREFEIYETGDTFNGKTVASAYIGIEQENYTRGWESISGDVKSVVFRDEIKPKTLEKWFYGFTNCENMNISKLNTEDVTNMDATFADCRLLTTLDVSLFKTDNVTNMSNMFYYCNNVEEINVSNFNTQNVTSMSFMFWGCNKVKELDVSKFNTDKVEYMTYMFRDCYLLKTLDVSKFNTSLVTNFGSMFSGCIALETLDVSGFNTENVAKMSYMFLACENLKELDVSNFNTEKVDTMAGMFNGCKKLEVIDVSNFNTEKVTDMENMFYLCEKVKVLDLSKWKTDLVTDMNEMFVCCYELQKLDLNGFSTEKVTDMHGIFNACNKLEEVTLGPKFEFKDNSQNDGNQYLPVPNSNYIPGATGFWYDSETGTKYETENIPNNKAATYVAVSKNYTYDIVYKSTSGIELGTSTIEKALGTINTISAPEIEGYITPASQDIAWDSIEAKTITFEYEPIEYNIELTLNGGTLDSIVSTAKVGDYVNYSANGVDSWRVFDIRGGKVLITPAIGSVGSLYLSDIKDYVTGISKIEDACDSYINPEFGITEDEVRSMTIEDLDNAMEYTAVISDADRYAYYLNEDSTYTTGTLEYEGHNYKKVKHKESSYNFNKWKFPRFYTWDYAENISGDENGYLYAYPTEGKPVYVSGNASCNYIQPFTVRHVNRLSITVGSLLGSKEGWLASQCIDTKSDYVIYRIFSTKNEETYGCQMIQSSGFPHGNAYGVRPIIELDSSFRVTRENDNTSWNLIAGGTDKVTKTYTIETETFSLGTPIKNGYDFTGWTGDNGETPETIVTIVKGTIGEKSYAANWDATQYSITINCNGGSGVSNMSYTVETPTFTIGTPTRSGYIFIGWTDVNGVTHETVTIERGSTGARKYTAKWEKNDIAQAIYSATDNSLTFIKNVPQTVGETYNGKTITAVYTGFEKEIYDETNLVPWSNYATSINSVYFENEIKPISTAFWFEGMTSCTTLNLTNLDTSNITDMTKMFFNCKELTTLEIGNWNTANVTSFRMMFSDDGLGSMKLQQLDVSNWDTSSATDMQGMFEGCGQLISLDLSKWNVEKVKDMSYMFGDCTNITDINISGWDTSSCQTINGMFNDCENITTINTNELDLDSCTDIAQIFEGCLKLKTLDLSEWNMSKVESSYEMFDRCYLLEEVKLGAGFKFIGTTGYLPEQSDEYISGADGKWYDIETGIGYDPVNVHKNANKTVTYVATNQSYSISYNLNGGTLTSGNPTSYKKYDSDIILGTPTRVGYTFVGWTGSNGNEPQTTVTISKGSTGDKTYSANWLANTYEVRYNVNGGSGAMSNSTHVYDFAKSLSENTFTRNGYTFKGWATTANGAVEYNDKATVSNLTSQNGGIVNLYAVWNPTSYNITIDCNGGSGVTHMSYTIETPTFTIGTPTRSGYTFVGWTDVDGVTHESVTITKGSTGARNYTANWEKNKTPGSLMVVSGITLSVGQRGTINVAGGNVSGGTVTMTNSDNTVISTTFDGSTVSVVGLKAGTAILTFTVAETESYTSATAQSVVTVTEPAVAQALYFSSDNSLVFIKDTLKSAGGKYNGKTITAVYTGIETDTYTSASNVAWNSKIASITSIDFVNEISPVSTAYWFYGFTSLTEIKNISNLNTSNVTNMSNMFNSCELLTSLNLSTFNTSKVTDMNMMFRYCDALTTIIFGSGWNTSKVTDMSCMFDFCTGLTTLDVSGWDTQNVTDMLATFRYCSKLQTIDVSGWNTAKVTSMNQMFLNCSSVTRLDVSNFNTDNVTTMVNMFASCSGLTALDLSRWNTAKVTDMSSMFKYCSNLKTIDMSNFDTTNVTDMNMMFYECRALEVLDISKFNTSKVTNMSNMFQYCEKLITVYASNLWSTAAVISSSNMFYMCFEIKGGAGTTYVSNKITKEYARIDGGTSNPGYFTNVDNTVYLYNNGDQCTSITGGWATRNQDWDDQFGGKVYYAVSQIDLTNYTTLEFTGTLATTGDNGYAPEYCYLGIWTGFGLDHYHNRVKYLEANNAYGTRSIDVSGLSGSYYIGIFTLSDCDYGKGYFGMNTLILK